MFNVLSFLVMIFSQFTSAEVLSCRMYDLATAQILEEKPLLLEPDKTELITFDVLGVKGTVFDEPVTNEIRRQTVKIDNGQDRPEIASAKYRLEDLSRPSILPWVKAEIPGMGDMLQLGCTKESNAATHRNGCCSR